MRLQFEIPQNARKNTSRDKQTTKNVPLIFSDAKMLTER